jgi:pyrimidine-specific ribonucleoside hydrolase
VSFVDEPFPLSVFKEDIRPRIEAIRAKNGEDEWFSMILMNELHDHLGAYSIIGAKMGLRAAELLNAPPHSMDIVSFAPATQPVSCLNDGLTVSTGSTPGRVRFRHEPQPGNAVRASFAWNGRRLVLRLKSHYDARIRATIQELVSKYGLEDAVYWDGVRTFGLDLWENWHRRDLFEIESTEDGVVNETPRAP